MCKRYGDHIEWAPSEHIGNPAVLHLMDANPMNAGSGTVNQQFADVPIAPFADSAQLLLAASGMLFRNQPKPGCKMARRGKMIGIADGRCERGGREGTDGRYLHQTATNLVAAGC